MTGSRPSGTISIAQAHRMRQEGHDEGLLKGRQEILDWLEAAYLGPNAPARKTPEAEAILKVAADAAAHFRKVVKKGAKR